MKLSDIEERRQACHQRMARCPSARFEDRIAVHFHQEMLRVIMWLVSIQMTIALGILGGGYFMHSHWKA